MTIEFGALAVADDLVEIGIDHADQIVGLVALVVVERRASQRLAQFVEQFARQRREIVDEVQRVLDLVGDAGGELAERGELFRLHQPVLRLAQIVERGGEFARARLHSSNRRTFSIAITACSAKVSTSLICLSVKGLASSL